MLTNPEGGLFETAYLLQGKRLNTYSKIKKVCDTLSVPKQTMDRLLERPTYNLSRLTPYGENSHGLLSCLDICVYYHSPLMFCNYSLLAELYTAVTGIEMTSDELRKTA
jgi:aldehyde:ferredoxin oxidoreductase